MHSFESVDKKCPKFFLQNIPLSLLSSSLQLKSTLMLLLPYLLFLLLAPACIQSAPNYDTFIRTHLSRSIHKGPSRSSHQHNTFNDHPDSAHRGGSHREQPHDKDVVYTTTGALRGIRRTVLDKNEVHVYYGVPFAKPPLGPLRFKKPVPLDPWNGTLNAFHQPNTCYQDVSEIFPGFKGEVIWLPNTNISEDCLYMNIWVPKPKKHNKKLPILLWIYGGGYVSGTATLDIYNADILAAENNVIVVEPQYRVGAFGFLYMGVDDAPGNMGLYDQVMAIQWIKDNAAKFGGDPDSITVFGESAGGASVTSHLISPISRHLLERGIIQSGTINAPWSIMTAKRAREIADKLIVDSSCINADGSSMSVSDAIQCLRDMPASNISTLQWNSYSTILNFMSAPTIDGVFLPKDPMEMLREGDFKKVPLLIGSNRDEGSLFILYDFIEHFKKDGPNCISPDIFKDIYKNVFENRTRAEREAIRFQYTHWEDAQDPCKATKKFIDFVGDYYFICPTNKFAETYASHGAPVYYYFFTQRTSSSPWGDWMGVMHTDEIQYVFGLPLNNSNEHTPAETDLSRRIMKYFTLFAETGNPMDDAEEWPLYTKEQPNYFIFNAEERGTGRGPRSHTCAFWNEFMPLITPSTNALPGECGGSLVSGGSPMNFIVLLGISFFAAAFNGFSWNKPF
jgi:acetylcholinesterase